MSLWSLCALMINFLPLDRVGNNVCIHCKFFVCYLHLNLSYFVFDFECVLFPSGYLYLFISLFPTLEELGSLYPSNPLSYFLHILLVVQSTPCYGIQLSLTFLLYNEASVSVTQTLAVVNSKSCWSCFKDPEKDCYPHNHWGLEAFVWNLGLELLGNLSFLY